MKMRIKKGQWKKAGTACVLLFFLFGILFNPEGTSDAAQSGIILAVETVIPALFPFLVLSQTVLNLHIADSLHRLTDQTLSRLFGINPDLACAWLLGLICGYPVGARCVTAVYEEKRCSREDAQRVLGYANNCGPAFFISVVGVYLFGNAVYGLLLYCIHIFAAFLLGILSRKKTDTIKSTAIPTQIPTFSKAFVKAVRDSTISMLHISGFVILFSVLIRIADMSHVFKTISYPVLLCTDSIRLQTLFEKTLTGIMEVSCGIKNLQSFTDAVYLPVVCSFLLGFGGLCVFCQTAAVVSDLSLKNYFWSKVKHGLVCAALTLLFLPVFSFLKTNTISKTEFTPTSSVMIANPGEVFSFSCGIAILFLIFLYFFHRSNKKRLFFFTPMRYDRKQKRNHRIYRCFFHNSNFIHSALLNSVFLQLNPSGRKEKCCFEKKRKKDAPYANMR